MRTAMLAICVLLLSLVPALGHDQRCTLTTGHVELEKGESTTLLADFTNCGSSLADFFGYRTRRNNSRQLRRRDHVRLTVTNLETGEVVITDQGWIRLLEPGGHYHLEATNTARQPVTVRLRAVAQ